MISLILALIFSSLLLFSFIDVWTDLLLGLGLLVGRKTNENKINK